MSTRQNKKSTTKVVVIVNEKDGTLTASWLGHCLLKKAKLPLDFDAAKEAVDCVVDREKRVALCAKRGIAEQMANESAAAGDGEQFANYLESFLPPDSKKQKLASTPKSLSSPKAIASNERAPLRGTPKDAPPKKTAIPKKGSALKKADDEKSEAGATDAKKQPESQPKKADADADADDADADDEDDTSYGDADADADGEKDDDEKDTEE